MSGKIVRWAELKTTDFGRDGDNRVALLPVAAIEQHGPHLPLGTDTFIVEAMVARLEGKLSGGTEVVLLPTQSIGDSTEHADFPGTLTQDAESLIEAWFAIGEAVSDSGIRKLVILNAHGGQPQIVDIVAKQLRAGCDMLVGRINTFLLGVPDGLFSADELAFGFHGGELETSMMLSIAPQLVDMDAAKNFPNFAVKLTEEFKALRAEGPAAIGWQAQDLNRQGAMGNAAAADPERGGKLLDYLSTRVAEALDDMAKFSLTHLREGPL
jgi:creatinine amidohydrolase